MMTEQKQWIRMGDGSGSGKRLMEKEERLDIVDLSGLSMDSLPKASLNLTTICKLNLSNNNLQSIPESLTARLLNVVAFDVHFNQLKCLPNSIGCLSKLKTLNVIGGIECELQHSHKAPRFNGVRSNTREETVIELKQVGLSPSIHHPSHVPACSGRTPQLPSSYPEDMENLINLQINVSQNFQYLQNLPYSIGHLVSLVELDVSYNKIATLPDSIGCMKRLQKLSVEGNPLVSPPTEVFEQGLHTVKEYLGEKMNAGRRGPQKKKSWVGKLVKCGTFNGSSERGGRKGFIISEYRSIDGLTPSPRYMGVFSPRRLFSSGRYVSR
ncbi:Plant intracellular Ras-group-related LRR protein 6 [Hibiscus syriacus]|uniref:Plant intracellular Ras-group-related LRR protein 6 n=1 Tax=Hibiscus syriacus TaxID=106335 RepID=A0A6A3ALV6_HIBSY|nr:Plant intracellular Ras-group-related LRR protein 6 [Hibiscus syriacus]